MKLIISTFKQYNKWLNVNLLEHIPDCLSQLIAYLVECQFTQTSSHYQ
jgi:hypothetical protein